ncbi:MAG TPA: DUF2442 domain-containing protein [Tepidisphaeraceae bacterium]|nr:DUF2442 domain-containing protein [Tepidisphaeraceae bacterium]
MSTGKAKASKPRDSRLRNLAVDLKFRRGKAVVYLADGREVAVPLELFPTLQRASARERAGWELIGIGEGFHWPTFDLDLEVEGMIAGDREAIPKPPLPHPDIVRRRRAS